MDVLDKIKAKLMESKEQNSRINDSKLNNQDLNLLEKIIRVEWDIVLLNHLFPDAQKQIQRTLDSLAESNQKMTVHFEQTKRYYERLDELENLFKCIQNKFVEIDSAILDIRLQLKELNTFSETIKRFTWIVITSFLGICIWFTQKWIKR